jgi:hypothetical protein
VSQLNTSPTFPHPTHTCLVMPQPLKGRKIMIIADEDVAKLRPAPPADAAPDADRPSSTDVTMCPA